MMRFGTSLIVKRALNCHELVELVTDYFEGALSRRDRKRFDAHIAVCDHCTLYIEQLRQTIVLTGTLREADVRPEARVALLAQFAQWKQERA
jgi:anti-sigma factor RsiW